MDEFLSEYPGISRDQARLQTLGGPRQSYILAAQNVALPRAAKAKGKTHSLLLLTAVSKRKNSLALLIILLPYQQCNTAI